jgi:hypothetical protein
MSVVSSVFGEDYVANSLAMLRLLYNFLNLVLYKVRVLYDYVPIYYLRLLIISTMHNGGKNYKLYHISPDISLFFPTVYF